MTKIAILGGVGHVGLPFGLALRQEGFFVGLFDQNKAALSELKMSKFPFLIEDLDANKKINSDDFFRIEIDDQSIVNYDVLICCIPITFHEDLFLKLQTLLRSLRASQTLIVRSTMPIGKTRKLIEHLFEIGVESIAYCPERMAQGETLAEIKKIPQIFYANNQQAHEKVAEIFSKVSSQLIELPLEEVEFSKIMCNAWRYQEFAIANQFYMISEQKGLSFKRILKAVKASYPRALHFSNAGLVGGPCLAKDNFFLNQFGEESDLMGKSAQKVHDALPAFLVFQLEKKLGSLNQKKILILGVAYKGNSDDVRNSRVIEVAEILKVKGSEIILSDPFIFPEIDYESILDRVDGVVIGCPHMNYQNICLHKPFVDCWNIVGE